MREFSLADLVEGIDMEPVIRSTALKSKGEYLLSLLEVIIGPDQFNKEVNQFLTDKSPSVTSKTLTVWLRSPCFHSPSLIHEQGEIHLIMICCIPQVFVQNCSFMKALSNCVTENEGRSVFVTTQYVNGWKNSLSWA